MRYTQSDVNLGIYLHTRAQCSARHGRVTIGTVLSLRGVRGRRIDKSYRTHWKHIVPAMKLNKYIIHVIQYAAIHI